MNRFLFWIKDFWSKERVILIIAFFSMFVSLAYSFYFRITPAVDARAYDIVAMNIVQGNGFILDENLSIEKDEVITYQGPAFQYFLAGIYKIFGHNYEAVWFFNAFLRFLSVLFIYSICCRIFKNDDKKIGWWAASIFGFYPDLVEISAMLMTETLFIFLVVLTAYIFIRCFEELSYINLVLLSFCFGVAVLARSSVGAFLLVFLFFFFKRRAWKQAILFLAIFGLVMVPWAVRNYRVYHVFLPTMANFGYNFFVGNRLGADGEGGNPPELFAAQEKYGMINANYWAFDQFKSFVKEHPFIYSKLTLSRAMKYFSFARPMGFWFYQRGLGQLLFVLSSVLFGALLFIFGFAGILIWFFKERENKLLSYIFSFAFLTFLSVVPILIETRYRLPIYPFIAIFAGLAASRFVSLWTGYKKYFWGGLAAALTISFTDIFLEITKIIDKLQQIFK